MKIDIIIKDVGVEEAAYIVSKLTPQEALKTMQEIAEKHAPAGKLGPISITNDEAVKEATDTIVETAQKQLEQQTTALVAPEAAGELDVEGYPWDKRIHSGNRKKKADGTWHKRKGCDDETWNSVRAELKFAQAPPMPTAPVAEVPAAPAAPPPMPTAPQPAAVAPVAPVQGGDFNSLLTKIQQGMTNGSITAEYVTSIVARLNQQHNLQMNAITDIMQNQPMIDQAFALMAQDGK